MSQDYYYFLTCNACEHKGPKKSFMVARPVEAGGGYFWQCPNCGQTDSRELIGSKELVKEEVSKK